MNARHLIVTAGIMFLLGGTAQPSPPPKTSEPHPAFALSPTAKRKLVQDASKLRVGDSYEAVIAALGKPTYDRAMMRKENATVVGRSLLYYAVRWDARLSNALHDQLVSVWLDTHNIVRDVSIRITLPK